MLNKDRVVTLKLLKCEIHLLSSENIICRTTFTLDQCGDRPFPIPFFFLAIPDCKTVAPVLSIFSSSHNLAFVSLQQDQTFFSEFVMNRSPNVLDMPMIHAMISGALLIPFIFF
ncbi:unnamed protein product [Vicia faba]|uniref:Uncharacterized protein n=1 Tax=Vicia faba TaxID=3906 RepID=A0AAV1AM25_VICFA|nr:unnamed protein product [Vicia faba]